MCGSRKGVTRHVPGLDPAPPPLNHRGNDSIAKLILPGKCCHPALMLQSCHSAHQTHAKSIYKQHLMKHLPPPPFCLSGSPALLTQSFLRSRGAELHEITQVGLFGADLVVPNVAIALERGKRDGLVLWRLNRERDNNPQSPSLGTCWGKTG